MDFTSDKGWVGALIDAIPSGFSKSGAPGVLVKLQLPIKPVSKSQW